MSTYQILYNPRSDNGHGEAEVKSLSNKLESNELIFNDITKIGDIKAFINSLGADEKIIIDVIINVLYGSNIVQVAQNVQDKVMSLVQASTGFDQAEVNVHVAGISFDK